MADRIATGIAFLAGIIGGVYLYRAGFHRGRVEQSRIVRAERARAAFEPMSLDTFEDIDVDAIAREFKAKHIGGAVR
jgi:hypothetical protein